MSEQKICPSQLLLNLPHLALECLIAHLNRDSLVALLKASKATRKLILDHAPKLTFFVEDGIIMDLLQVASRSLDIHLEICFEGTASEQKMQQLLITAVNSNTAAVKRLTLYVGASHAELDQCLVMQSHAAVHVLHGDAFTTSCFHSHAPRR